MGIIGKLLGSGDEDVESVETADRVDTVSHVRDEPVHDWFSEDAYDVDESLGEHSDTSPDYGTAMSEMADTSFDMLDTAEMGVSDEMRGLVKDSYRIVEMNNGDETLTAAYLNWEDNVGEAFSDLLWQATYRNDEGDLTVDDFAVERAVDMMYDEVESINQELRSEGVDVIGGRRNSTVKASARASRYDDRSCMSNNSMIGWGEPGISSHVGFSLKRVDRDTLHVGSKDHETRGKIKEEVEDRLDFYHGRAYDAEGTVEEVAEEFREFFDRQEEVQATVDQKIRTDRVDRMMANDREDLMVYDDESFTYETQDEYRRTNFHDKGLREFDSIAKIVEGNKVSEYQEA